MTGRAVDVWTVCDSAADAVFGISEKPYPTKEAACLALRDRLLDDYAERVADAHGIDEDTGEPLWPDPPDADFKAAALSVMASVIDESLPDVRLGAWRYWISVSQEAES